MTESDHTHTVPRLSSTEWSAVVGGLTVTVKSTACFTCLGGACFGPRNSSEGEALEKRPVGAIPFSMACLAVLSSAFTRPSPSAVKSYRNVHPLASAAKLDAAISEIESAALVLGDGFTLDDLVADLRGTSSLEPAVEAPRPELAPVEDVVVEDVVVEDVVLEDVVVEDVVISAEQQLARDAAQAVAGLALKQREDAISQREAATKRMISVMEMEIAESELDARTYKAEALEAEKVAAEAAELAAALSNEVRRLRKAAAATALSSEQELQAMAAFWIAKTAAFKTAATAATTEADELRQALDAAELRREVDLQTAGAFWIERLREAKSHAASDTATTAGTGSSVATVPMGAPAEDAGKPGGAVDPAVNPFEGAWNSWWKRWDSE